MKYSIPYIIQKQLQANKIIVAFLTVRHTHTIRVSKFTTLVKASLTIIGRTAKVNNKQQQ